MTGRMTLTALAGAAALAAGPAAWATGYYTQPSIPDPGLRDLFGEAGMVVGSTMDPYVNPVWLTGGPPGWVPSPLHPSPWAGPDARRVIDAQAVNQRLISATMGFTRRENVTGECAGYVAKAPDVRFQFRSNGQAPLFISAVPDMGDLRGDGGSERLNATLVVHWRPFDQPDAAGHWYCAGHPDDSNIPVLTIGNAPVGQYTIWVGVPSWLSPEANPRPLPAAKLYFSSQRPHTG